MSVTYFSQPKLNSDARMHLLYEIMETLVDWEPHFAFILAAKEKEFTHVHARILSYKFEEDHVLAKYFFEELHIHYPEITILSQEDNFNLPKETDFIAKLFAYLAEYPILLAQVYMTDSEQLYCQGYYNLLERERAHKITNTFAACFNKIADKFR